MEICVCVSLFRKVDNQLTSNETSVYEVREVNAVDRIQDATCAAWATRDAEGTSAQFFNATPEGKRRLERNMFIWDNNIKVVLKETSFGFMLNSSTI